MLIVIMILGITQLVQVGNYNFQRAQNIQIKQATSDITCGADTIIFAAGPYEAIESSYYLSDCKIYFYSEQSKLGGGYAMLSNSKLRVVDPAIQLVNSKTIYYIYYSEKKQQMPDNMIQASKQKFDSLFVEKYQTR